MPDPGVNSKKKSDSDEEEKEEDEREEEEEEVAAALIRQQWCFLWASWYIYACDHAKQGIETQIASDKHKDPVSEVTDGCESAKKYWMT